MRAGGWKWSFNHKFDGEMVVKIISSAVQKIEAVYFCIVLVLVLVLVEIHAGGNQGGMRNN